MKINEKQKKKQTKKDCEREKGRPLSPQKKLVGCYLFLNSFFYLQKAKNRGKRVGQRTTYK